MRNEATKPKRFQKIDGLSAVLMCAFVLLIIVIVLLASVPPVSRDALTHHLALLKLYITKGGIYEIPAAKWSYYPMNLDLLYLIPLYFGNDIVPKYIHFLFALLSAGLIYRYLNRRIDRAHALVGAIFFLSVPVIVKLSITVYVDLGLIFFSFAALLYFLKWIETDYRWTRLVASAICCGIALGTKYNGLIGFFLLTLFVVFVYSRPSPATPAKQTRALLYGAVFMLIAVVVFSPWAIRNYLWTNNPVYPLYNNWFNPRQAAKPDTPPPYSTHDFIKESDVEIKPSKASWSHFAVRKIIFDEKWWEISLIPIRIFFQGQDDHPKHFDGKLNPLLFFLPFFAFIGIKKDSGRLQTEKKILLAYAVLFILFAFVQRDMRIRYIGPAIPPLVILSIFGVQNGIQLIDSRFCGFFKKVWLGVGLAVLVFFASLNVKYIFNQYQIYDPISYLSGRVSRDVYIEKFRPEYAAIKYANNHLAADAKILGIFLGNRSYYSDREMRFDFNRFIHRAFEQKYSDEKILVNLKNSGITHLLIRYDLFNSWIGNNFDEGQRQRIDRFFKNYTILIFSKNGHGLYNLKST